MTDTDQMGDAGNLISMHPELVRTWSANDGLGSELASLGFAFDDLKAASGRVGHGFITDEPWPHGNLSRHSGERFKESLALLTAM